MSRSNLSPQNVAFPGLRAPAPVYDADTQAFLTATGIASAALATALDNRVLALKSAGLWNALRADYPFAGGTAFTHQFNLRNPANTDAAGRLTYLGSGITHTAQGFCGNATGWADTHIAPSSLPQNSVALSVYSRTEEDAVKVLLGAANAGLSNSLYLLPKFSSYNYSRLNNESAGDAGNVTSSLGWLLGVRSTATARAFYKTGTAFRTDSVDAVAPSTFPIYLGAVNAGGTAMYPAPHVLAAAQLWNRALTAGEASAFYNLEQAYQTALGRNV